MHKLLLALAALVLLASGSTSLALRSGACDGTCGKIIVHSHLAGGGGCTGAGCGTHPHLTLRPGSPSCTTCTIITHPHQTFALRGNGCNGGACAIVVHPHLARDAARV